MPPQVGQADAELRRPPRAEGRVLLRHAGAADRQARVPRSDGGLQGADGFPRLCFRFHFEKTQN